jgi:hypothetical protein
LLIVHLISLNNLSKVILLNVDHEVCLLDDYIWAHFGRIWHSYNQCNHELRTPREEIDFTA